MSKQPTSKHLQPPIVLNTAFDTRKALTARDEVNIAMDEFVAAMKAIDPALLEVLRVAESKLYRARERYNAVMMQGVEVQLPEGATDGK